MHIKFIQAYELEIYNYIFFSLDHLVTKTFAEIWFLVTGWCNEKNNKYIRIPNYQIVLSNLISIAAMALHQSRMHVLIWRELILWHFNFSELSLGLLPENKNIFIDSREFQIDDYVLKSALNFGNLKVHAIYQILIRYISAKLSSQRKKVRSSIVDLKLPFWQPK